MREIDCPDVIAGPGQYLSLQQFDGAAIAFKLGKVRIGQHPQKPIGQRHRYALRALSDWPRRR
jgi:hypothetical protein